MKITTYVDPTLADGYSSVTGISPDNFTPAPDFSSETDTDESKVDAEEYANARGRWKKRFKKLGKGVRYIPHVAVARAVAKKVRKKKKVGFSGDEFYNSDGETYSYIDQNNKTEVKAFQDWLDKKGLKWVKATDENLTNGTALNKGSGYGNFGTSTSKAYNRYGAEWEEYKKKAIGLMGAMIGVPTSSSPVSVPTTAPAVSGEPTPAQVEEQKKKGLFWDNAKKTWVSAKELGLVDYVLDVFGVAPKEPTPTPKKLSKTAKTILYVGGAVVIGLIIYAIAKPRKGA